MTTDTPRTDAEITRVGIDGDGDAYLHADFARELERELSASQAEVERLKKELADWDYGTRAKREQERAEKAEDEELESELKKIKSTPHRQMTTDTPTAEESSLVQTDTPRTDAWECFSDPSYYDMARLRRTDGPKDFNTGYHLNNLREAIEVRDTLNELERRAEKAEAEVERLTGRMKEAEDLIKGLHGGWKKARVAHLETCKNAQTEIDKLHTENICLQDSLYPLVELLDEFSRLWYRFIISLTYK